MPDLDDMKNNFREAMIRGADALKIKMPGTEEQRYKKIIQRQNDIMIVVIVIFIAWLYLEGFIF